MKRVDVRAFIETGINDLAQATGFNSGRITEFNSQPDKPYPFCWLESLSNDPEITPQQLVIDNWNVAIHVAMQDKMDSLPYQYESIIDDCDEIAKTLVTKYNLQVSGFKLMTIQSVSIEPFVKLHADCTTGVILSFVLNNPDTVNRCGL